MENLQNNCSLLGCLSPSATLVISGKAKELKKQGLNVCSLSAGEPDFDTPQAIKDACIKALNEGKVGYTPASGLPELKQAIVNKFAKNGISTAPENIVVSPGAKFAIFTAITSLCGSGDEVLIPAPYWLSYPEIVKAAGAVPLVVPTSANNHYQITAEQLEAAVTPKTKLLILNSPSNPAGTVYSKENLCKIAAFAQKHNLMILSDEIYEELIYDTESKHVSIASLSEDAAARTITVNGFSKAYAMTGWRLGYLTAPLWLAKRIAALQSHSTSNPTSFVQYAGIAALNGAADREVAEMRKAFGKRRDLICSLLSNIKNISFIKPNGAFYVLCDISSFGLSSELFCQKLLKEALVAAIPCNSFGAEGYIRLSYACSEENIAEAIQRLGKFCANLTPIQKLTA